MILSILIIIVCALLVLVVLVQNSKGGGIQSQFGAATQIMGVKRGTEFIEKATWGLVIVLIAFCVFGAPKSSTGGASTSSSEITTKIKEKTANAPSIPTSQPAGGNNQPQMPTNQMPK